MIRREEHDGMPLAELWEFISYFEYIEHENIVKSLLDMNLHSNIM